MMAAVIAAEAREMPGVRSEIGNTGIDYATCAFGQSGETGARLMRSLENKPQSLPDQIS